MPQGQDLETAQRVGKPDGSFQMSGCVMRGVTHEVFNAGAAVILPGDLVCILGPTMARWDTGDSEAIPITRLNVRRSVANSTDEPVGIALEPIDIGASGEVAGMGSYVMANADPSATLVVKEAAIVATGALQHGKIISTATPVIGRAVGVVVVANGVGAGLSGSLSQALILVNVR